MDEDTPDQEPCREKEDGEEQGAPEDSDQKHQQQGRQEQEERSDPGPKKSLREWLSGPQACLAVVGCGTLAAVVVVALVVVGLRLFATALSSPSADPDDSGQVVEERDPRETTEPGVLDVCSVGVEASGVLVNLDRIDDAEEPEDTATFDPPNPDGNRTVTDKCHWEMGSPNMSHWELTFEYKAIMSMENSSEIEVASEEFENEKGRLAQEMSSVESEGDISGTSPDEAYYYYSSSLEEDYDAAYAIVGLSKSAVFVLRVNEENEGGDSPVSQETEFRGEIEEVLPYINSDFERQIPD